MELVGASSSPSSSVRTGAAWGLLPGSWGPGCQRCPWADSARRRCGSGDRRSQTWCCQVSLVSLGTGLGSSPRVFFSQVLLVRVPAILVLTIPGLRWRFPPLVAGYSSRAHFGGGLVWSTVGCCGYSDLGWIRSWVGFGGRLAGRGQNAAVVCWGLGAELLEVGRCRVVRTSEVWLRPRLEL